MRIEIAAQLIAEAISPVVERKMVATVEAAIEWALMG